jgi:glycosyltransferase involved in cell wall biosynthesis
LRIGYESFLTGPSDTGVGIAIRELLGALARQYPNDFIVVFTNNQASLGLPRAANIRIEHVPLTQWGRGPRVVWQQTLACATLSGAGLDVYHGPGYVLPRRCPVPTVVTLYDTIALDHPELTSRLNGLYYGHAVPITVRNARRIIVPTVYVRDRLVSLLGISADKVRVAPLGVKDVFHVMTADEIGGCLGTRAVGDDYFLCVGNIEKKKNVGTVIDAFAAFKRGRKSGVKLVLAGKERNAARAVRKRVHENGLDKDVLFLGYVSDTELAGLYNGALALLYPSLEEGFGLPPLEAMACGAAVAASRLGALQEVLGDKALLLTPHCTGEWTRAMVDLWESPGLRGELGARGAAHAAQFTWVRCASRVHEVYREVLMEMGCMQ